MKNSKLINVYKPIGATPLQVIRSLKIRYPELENKKIAYAGRLDPMAEGVLLLLIFPETKNRSKYQNMDKEYEFEVLFGVTTDTYDILGKVTTFQLPISNQVSIQKSSKTQLLNILNTMESKTDQLYPPYSSKFVNGKPLYWWARNNKLDKIDIPKKEINIYSLRLVKIHEKTKKELSKEIFQRVNLVYGDFRQKEIKENWNNFFKLSKEKFTIAKVSAKCSSGTYIRSIANDIGIILGCGAIAYSIKRTSVGNHLINDSRIV